MATTMCILFLLVIATADLKETLELDGGLGEIHDYCTTDSFFEPKCGEDEAIIIKHARYGRMRESRCISKEGRMGCSVDVKDYLQQKCSGRWSCQVVISAMRPTDDPPCGMDLIGYLEVAHICVKVVMGPYQSCDMKRALEIREPFGYLSSYVKEVSGCGSADAPWWISANPGQQLRLRLLYFGPPTDSGTSVCHVLALVTERESKHTESVCTGDTELITSVTNKLEVVFMTSNGPAEHTNYLLIEFESIGCPDPVTPSNGWIKRSGNDVTVGCYSRDDPDTTWNQHCDGSAWIGPSHNCTEGILVSSTSTQTWTLLLQSHGFYIMVTIGIVVCAGLCMLVFALIYMRRHWRRPQQVPAAKAEQMAADAKSARHSLIVDKVNDEYSYSTNSDYYRSLRTWPRGRPICEEHSMRPRAAVLPPYATVCSKKASNHKRRSEEEHEYEIPQLTKNNKGNEGRNTNSSRKYYDLEPSVDVDGVTESV